MITIPSNNYPKITNNPYMQLIEKNVVNNSLTPAQINNQNNSHILPASNINENYTPNPDDARFNLLPKSPERSLLNEINNNVLKLLGKI
jgi:hypothetical protein